MPRRPLDTARAQSRHGYPRAGLPHTTGSPLAEVAESATGPRLRLRMSKGQEEEQQLKTLELRPKGSSHPNWVWRENAPLAPGSRELRPPAVETESPVGPVWLRILLSTSHTHTLRRRTFVSGAPRPAGSTSLSGSF